MLQPGQLSVFPNYELRTRDKIVHLADAELNSYPVASLSEAILNAKKKAHLDNQDDPNTPNCDEPATDGNLKSGDLDFECTFCLEKILPTDKVRLIPCLHLFHQGCLDSWLTKFSACCPSCRFNMSSKLDK